MLRLEMIQKASKNSSRRTFQHVQAPARAPAQGGVKMPQEEMQSFPGESGVKKPQNAVRSFSGVGGVKRSPYAVRSPPGPGGVKKPTLSETDTSLDGCRAIIDDGRRLFEGELQWNPKTEKFGFVSKAYAEGKSIELSHEEADDAVANGIIFDQGKHGSFQNSHVRQSLIHASSAAELPGWKLNNHNIGRAVVQLVTEDNQCDFQVVQGIVTAYLPSCATDPYKNSDGNPTELFRVDFELQGGEKYESIDMEAHELERALQMAFFYFKGYEAENLL